MLGPGAKEPFLLLIYVAECVRMLIKWWSGGGGGTHRSTCSPQPTIGAFSAPVGQQQPLVSCPFRRRCDRQNGGSERRSIRRCPTRPRGRDARGARGWRPPALAALEFLSPSPRGSRLRQRFLLINALKRDEPNVYFFYRGLRNRSRGGKAALQQWARILSKAQAQDSSRQWDARLED